MISDSPPDRELEWTDEGIQSSKNLINRLERYFNNTKSKIPDLTIKNIERFIYDLENNILNFSLNKCVASIYTLLNYLEKNKIYLNNDNLSKKILICLYPMLPRLASSIYKDLFNEELSRQNWPIINNQLLEETDLILPIQIKGKLVTTIKTKKDYNEHNLLNEIYRIEKIKKKIADRKILKVINVPNKIINIITN